MTIKGNNGESYDVTGSGQGIYNTIGASAGILALLQNGGGGILGGILGGNRGYACSDDAPITRYDANMQHQIAAKDSEIALLKSEQSTDKKLVDVYAALKVSENNLRDRVDILDRELSAKITAERETRLVNEKEQAVFNQSMIGSTATINQQIQQLNTIVNNITTNVVPANKVCQTGCCCGC